MIVYEIVHCLHGDDDEYYLNKQTAEGRLASIKTTANCGCGPNHPEGIEYYESPAQLVEIEVSEA